MKRVLLTLALGLAACGPTPQTAGAPKDAIATAAAADPAPPVSQDRPSFVVRFRTEHPIGRAQALQAAGRCEEAARAVRAALTADRAFAGLCFDRFTVGGYETVLSSCDPVAEGQRSGFSQSWVERLRAMSGVEYVDANVTAEIGGCT